MFRLCLVFILCVFFSCDGIRTPNKTKTKIIADSELVGQSAQPKHSTSQGQQNCETLLADLVYTSSFKGNAILKGNEDKLIFRIDRYSNRVVYIMVLQKNPTEEEMTVALLEYDTALGTLQDVTVDSKNPIALTFKKQIGEKLLKTCGL